MRQAIRIDKGSFLHQVASDSKLTNRARIQRLYLAALARPAVGREIKMANQLLAARGGDVPEALRDIWWALLNSNEFILNH